MCSEPVSDGSVAVRILRYSAAIASLEKEEAASNGLLSAVDATVKPSVCTNTLSGYGESWTLVWNEIEDRATDAPARKFWNSPAIATRRPGGRTDSLSM